MLRLLDGDAFVKSKDPYGTIRTMYYSSTLFHVSFYNIFYVDADTVEELRTVQSSKWNHRFVTACFKHHRRTTDSIFFHNPA